MNIDEAIKHCRDKAEELRTEAEQLRDIGEAISNPRQPYNEPVKNCLECAKEHEQLADWLEELKAYREARDCNTCARYCEKQTEIPKECEKCCHNYFNRWKAR